MNKVLIIDDNEQNRGACQVALEDHFELSFATNGEDGLEKTREFDPDVILLDIMMPVMNGYEMLKQLKADPKLTNIPVLMLSANATIESIERCLIMKADDYVMKPFNIRVLRARAGGLARRGHLEKMRSEDLRTAATIQNQFLTGDIEDLKNIFREIGQEVSVFNQSPVNLSGDFYYLKPINNHSAGLFFADTSGHGLSAAMISMRIFSVIDHLRSPRKYASEFLATVSEDIQNLIPPGKFVAGSYLIFNDKKIIFSNAGLPYPILVREGVPLRVEAGGSPLGMMNGEYQNITKDWLPGDRLVLHTDGITEAANSHEELYGEARLCQCIEKNTHLPIAELQEQIIADLRSFVGETPFDDDITLMIFEKKRERNRA